MKKIVFACLIVSIILFGLFLFRGFNNAIPENLSLFQNIENSINPYKDSFDKLNRDINAQTEILLRGTNISSGGEERNKLQKIQQSMYILSTKWGDSSFINISTAIKKGESNGFSQEEWNKIKMYLKFLKTNMAETKKSLNSIQVGITPEKGNPDNISKINTLKISRNKAEIQLLKNINDKHLSIVKSLENINNNLTKLIKHSSSTSR